MPEISASEYETLALREACRLLKTWLDATQMRAEPGGRDRGADLVVHLGNQKLVVEVKGSSSAAVVGSAIAQAKSCAKKLGRATTAVVAVPYMGDVGQRLCAEAEVSWFDLSGNARIVAPGLRVIIEGKPNKFSRRGRPSSAFAPKSSRIARRLLIEPDHAFRQQDLARATGLDDGFTSRIVRRLEKDHLVDRKEDGTLRVRDPGLLLDAWAEVYDFEKHTILRGHVSPPPSDDLLSSLSGALADSGAKYATTGLAAAWLHTNFAMFRLVTFFVTHRPSDDWLRATGFREETRGANVWFVVPNDLGVFDGAERKHGIECVHPVQAYLDVLAHPERSKEAAAELRTRLLPGGH